MEPGAVARAARPGDICILLASSRPVPARARAMLDGLRQVHGGRIVEPLHVTVDRVATSETERVVRAARAALSRLRQAPVRVDRAFVIDSRDRGPHIVKLEVVRDSALVDDVAELRSALREVGLPSLHGGDRLMTVSALEHAGPAREGANAWPVSTELFLGDLVIVSRIRGPASYEVLDTATIAASR